MHSLHLLAGEALFEEEIQADQAKDDGYGLAFLTGMMRCEAIYGMLVQERRVLVTQRVEA